MRELLGLPQHIRQEDGTRDTFEAVFQSIDGDDSKEINFEEFATWFSASAGARERTVTMQMPGSTPMQVTNAEQRMLRA